MTTPPVAPAPDSTSGQILIALGEIKTELAVIREQLKDLPDHEARIRVLEASRARIAGACAAIALVVSAAGTWIGLLVTRR